MNRLISRGLALLLVCGAGFVGASKHKQNIGTKQLPQGTSHFAFAGERLATAYHAKKLFEQAPENSKVSEYHELEFEAYADIFGKETKQLSEAITALKGGLGQHVTVKKKLGSGLVTQEGLIKEVVKADDKMQGVTAGDPMQTPIHHIVLEDGKRISLRHDEFAQLVEITMGPGK